MFACHRYQITAFEPKSRLNWVSKCHQPNEVSEGIDLSETGSIEGAEVTMRIFFTCIAMCIVLLSIASAEAPARTSIMDVSRADGSLQCGAGPAISLKETIAEVGAAGIAVLDARSAHDGRKRIAMCGAPTGQMHILSISSGDFEAVQALGFEDFSLIQN